MAGSASSTRFALSNTATQRGRLYATGTGLTSGAVFGWIAGRSAALTTITNCICDCPLLHLQRICSKTSPVG
jgi:hypothetical protein